MASGKGENDDLTKSCDGFKHDLEDALDHLNDISKSSNLPTKVKKQVDDLGKMLRDAKEYADDNRFLALDAESLPNRR